MYLTVGRRSSVAALAFEGSDAFCASFLALPFSRLEGVVTGVLDQADVLDWEGF